MAAPRASAPLLRSMMMMSRPSSSTALHRATASQRYLSTSKPLFNTTAALPVSKPVGAFRGGLFGFLFGSAVAGASVYYYILEEYRVSNEMLTEDIYALQAATQRLNAYIVNLEGRLDQLQKKK